MTLRDRIAHTIATHSDNPHVLEGQCTGKDEAQAQIYAQADAVIAMLDLEGDEG